SYDYPWGGGGFFGWWGWYGGYLGYGGPSIGRPGEGGAASAGAGGFGMFQSLAGASGQTVPAPFSGGGGEAPSTPAAGPPTGGGLESLPFAQGQVLIDPASGQASGPTLGPAGATYDAAGHKLSQTDAQ